MTVMASGVAPRETKQRRPREWWCLFGDEGIHFEVLSRRGIPSPKGTTWLSRFSKLEFNGDLQGKPLRKQRGPIVGQWLTLTFRAKRRTVAQNGKKYGAANGWTPRGVADEASMSQGCSMIYRHARSRSNANHKRRSKWCGAAASCGTSRC